MESDDDHDHPDSEIVESPQEERKQVWHDPDDEIGDEDGLSHRRTKIKGRSNSKYANRLVDNFQLVYGPTPSWAQFKRKKETFDDDEAPKQKVQNKKESKSKTFSRYKLDYLSLCDLNGTRTYNQKIINSVEFHPSSQVALVGNSTGSVHLHKVDGKTNPEIQTVRVEKYPLRNACFNFDGNDILISSGKSNNFFIYEMITGKTTPVKPSKITEHETIRNIIPSPTSNHFIALGHQGNMYLFSRRSKEIIATLSMSGDVTHGAFSNDGSTLYSYGELGEVYIWDVKNRVCVNKFIDEGAIRGSQIAVGSKYLACGSNTGAVNLYETEGLRTGPSNPGENRPQPCKTFMNLVTNISTLQFNHDDSALAMGSVELKDALRIVHLPSLSVFPNFPGLHSPIGRPNSLAFSPKSGFLAVGNNYGRALLYRLNYFDNY